jgi:flagellar basal-body rod protein FlgC
MYDAIGTAGTGLQTYHTWLDVIANNIANMNDTSATSGKVFEQHFVQAGEVGGGDASIGDGVAVHDVTEAPGNGEVVNDPSNPLADANGDIRRTDVNLNEQMGDMIAAQRAFQANADVVDRAKDVYEAAIGIGKGI